jgi:L-ascorbate metabolism protein UlaG (beta-lactamase superfamily)
MPDDRPVERCTLTWVGHASVLIELGGFRILTDPLLTTGVGHLRRRAPLPDLGPVDVVLLSHLHLDHAHSRSLRMASPGAEILVPHGAEPLVRSLGFTQVTQVSPGDHVSPAGRGTGVTVEVVPAVHDARRSPFSRLTAPPVGYVVRTGDRGIYFAGDTDLFDGMKELGAIDVALLPIWGWGPTLGEGHLNPSRAAIAAEWIDPRRVVPIHWGTYSPVRLGPGPPSWLDRPLAEFRVALRTHGLEDRLVVVPPGGVVSA